MRFVVVALCTVCAACGVAFDSDFPETSETSGGGAAGAAATGGAGAGQGGAAGEGTGGGCPMELAPPGGTCPAECNGGCMDNVCRITCDDTTPCEDATLICPAGFACEVTCTGTQKQCAGAFLTCPDDFSCTVYCLDGDKTCEEMDILCSPTRGACTLHCGSDEQCEGNSDRKAELHCGADACTASCAGGTEPIVHDCDAACACAEC